MKYVSLIILVILLFNELAYSQCEYENSTSNLGIGLVAYDKDNRTIPDFEVFNDPELTDKFCSWDVYNDFNSEPFCAKILC